MYPVPEWMRYHPPSLVPEAFGSASDGASVFARVAGYHYGSLSGSGWIAFCT